jgi:5-formyltetrahydrofolate cyclo-ligase
MRLRASGPIRAVGVAYSVSEIDAAPDEPHDQRLDFILTEREWIDARGRS